MPKADNSAKIDSPPLKRLYARLVLSVLAIETAAMLIFHFLLVPLCLPSLSAGLADSLFSIILLIPVLYFLFYRPLLSQAIRNKQALESIQKLKASHGVIIRTAMDGFWLIDTQGHILEVNDSYCRLTGYSRRELLTMSLFDVRAQEKPEDTKKHIQRVIESGGDRFESHHRCKDGRIVDLDVSVNYLSIDGGRIFAFLRDITERKKIQKELEEASAVSNSLIQTIPFGMDIVDKHGSILYLSPKMEAVFGKEAIGKKCWEIYRDDKAQCLNCPLLNGEVVPGETAVIVTGGVLGGRTFEISHTGMLYQGGQAILEIFNDVTERRRMEDDLRKANQRLLELDRLKSEFINMSSHELRTPIAIIREGISQMVEGLHGELKPQQRYFLDKSFKNVNRLIRIVDNIFEVSEIESGRLPMEKEVVDMAELARAAISGFGPEIKKSGLEIKENFPGSKIELEADKKKINRALTELIKNAVRFTGKGYIEVSIEDKGDKVECAVKDTGIGIAEENLPKLFDKFWQFSRDYGPGERGVGLGLPIAKGLIELHKGRIWAESRLGEGSKFTFSLPKAGR